ncbi:MAG: TIGR02391 family protein [Candidatus Poribacteria bacterium]|nr:TIGR02391 family protein [Candidatus Poribacteria bacterium]
MSFDPNTIEHLGVRMYSTLPPVLAELIANAYDADAEHVTLTLNDQSDEKEIVIEDDGIGMAFDDINEKFLRIGRNRRSEESADTTPKRRKIIGKKGLGKLSYFGIAREIGISTRKDGKENSFRMRWEDIKHAEQHDYKPEILKTNSDCSFENHGTTIVLRKLQRKTDFEPETLANSLSRMFIIELGFEVKIKHNTNEPICVTNERRYATLDNEVEWKMPDDSPYSDEYDKSDQIRGHLMATKKPIPPNTDMRGITLFSRKKLVNSPGHFSDSTSSHFFSYLTGWLEVDFIDDLEDDVIATNRQSLNWGHEETKKLHDHLRGLINRLERDWRKKRTKIREKKISDATEINISKWFDKVPDDVRVKLKPVVLSLVRDAELPEEMNTAAVKNLHEIVPEYPKYHWRHLHDEIKAVSESCYKKGEYYGAFYEAVKRYMNVVRIKSGWPNVADANMMEAVFGKNSNYTLQVAEDLEKIGRSEIHSVTLQNIQEGQKLLSKGIVTGCRNPLSHEEVNALSHSRLFTEKDCLDALSLLSHLFRRLDKV